jgi:predicted nuclease with TOPRIM domain
MSQDIEDIKNMPPPVLEQKIELPHIPQIDESEFEDMKFNVKQLRSDNSQLHDMLQKMRDALVDKVDNIIFDKNMDKKIDRDDVYLLMEKFSMEDDRIKKVQ